jgi:hypothetical protein
MKIIKISASFSQKYQLKQFEPIDIFASAEAEVDESTDDLHAAYQSLYTIVKTQVAIQLEKFK